MSRHWTLITGASSGIGEAFARIAAKAGRNLIISARRRDRLEALAEELRAGAGVFVEVIEADLATQGAAEALWRAATAEGRKVDFLINNAGLGRHGPFGFGTEADGGWAREQASIEVNIVALTALMNAAVPAMKAEGGGRILNVASLAGMMPGPGMAVYHASKAYVVTLGRAVGEELRGSGVSVTTLCPGATESEFFDQADMRGARILKLGPVPTSESVAQAGYDGALARRAVVTPGVMNKASMLMAKLAPHGILVKSVGFVMGKG